jgi:site-specific DNA-cytosine methylase
VAWHPLGWQPAWFSEIEPFPSAVLKHYYPTVPNYGDMTQYEAWPNEPINLLVGGTPCQSFSVAGLRKGLADPRGNLMLTYGAIAQRYRPRWLVWENVPGVLSSNGGRDFGTFLGMLAELGYGFAYRVLDAQYFGVAQRRRRVFVVGYLGDWHRAAAVVFERKSLSRDTPQIIAEKTRIGRVFPCLTRRGLGCLREEEGLVAEEMGIRHLTSVECERLQGFPDNYTNIPWRKKKESPNGLRVGALGNSMAVPVMRWIGERIAAVEAL